MSDSKEKLSNFLPYDEFFQAENTSKSFAAGAGGAYDARPDMVDRHPFHSHPVSTPSASRFGASILAHPMAFTIASAVCGTVFHRMSPLLHLSPHFTLVLKPISSLFLIPFLIPFHLFSARTVPCHFGHYNGFFTFTFYILITHASQYMAQSVRPGCLTAPSTRNAAVNCDRPSRSCVQ